MNIRHKIAAAALTAMIAVPVVTAVSTGTAQATLGGCTYTKNTSTEWGTVTCSYATTAYRVRLKCQRTSDGYTVNFYATSYVYQGGKSGQTCRNLPGYGYPGTWNLTAVYVNVP